MENNRIEALNEFNNLLSFKKVHKLHWNNKKKNKTNWFFLNTALHWLVMTFSSFHSFISKHFDYINRKNEKKIYFRHYIVYNAAICREKEYWFKILIEFGLKIFVYCRSASRQILKRDEISFSASRNISKIEVVYPNEWSIIFVFL